MRVLVACEFSGVVRDAFIKRGHDAMSCDLLPTERQGPHYQGDVFDIIHDDWDLMIAHPPCTFLTNAGAVHYYGKKAKNVERRKKKGLEAKDFFMGLYNSPIPRICIENPNPLKMFKLPLHSQTIQPFQYGHPFSKRTLLWLKNLPLLKPTNIMEEVQSTKVPGNWFNKGGKDRQKNRAKTFQGIADAMAEQWGSLTLTDRQTDKGEI
jgi:hypothetical protein